MTTTMTTRRADDRQQVESALGRPEGEKAPLEDDPLLREHTPR